MKPLIARFAYWLAFRLALVTQGPITGWWITGYRDGALEHQRRRGYRAHHARCGCQLYRADVNEFTAAGRTPEEAVAVLQRQIKARALFP